MKFRFTKHAQSDYPLYEDEGSILKHSFDVIVEAQLPNQPENADDWRWIGRFNTEEDALIAAKYFADTYSVVELEV